LIGLVSELTRNALFYEWYAEYPRVINPDWCLSLDMVYAEPQACIKDIVADAKNWLGVLVNLTFRY
jgi:hypothetical protein